MPKLVDGSVITWGNECTGGDSTYIQSQSKKAVTIYPTYDGFAAKLEDKSVVVWGRKCVKLQFVDVDTIQCTAHVSAVKLKNGSVVTWGGRFICRK